MYLVISRREKKAVVVDPADPEKVLAICAAQGVELVAVLTTHYHADHSGGNVAIAEQIPGIPILAGKHDADRTPAVNWPLVQGERFTLAGLPFRSMETPCHTRGHVSFVLDAQDGQAPALFCGDTLFVGGCGRFMEGDAADMRAALGVLSQLPPQTRIFCGHEYTVSNLRFAAALEPDNDLIVSHLREAQARRDKGLPTVPAILKQEAEHNPFLRVLQPRLTGLICPECAADPLRALEKVRRRKDTWTLPGTIITWALDVQGAFMKISEFGADGVCAPSEPARLSVSSVDEVPVLEVVQRNGLKF